MPAMSARSSSGLTAPRRGTVAPPARWALTTRFIPRHQAGGLTIASSRASAGLVDRAGDGRGDRLRRRRCASGGAEQVLDPDDRTRPAPPGARRSAPCACQGGGGRDGSSARRAPEGDGDLVLLARARALPVVLVPRMARMPPRLTFSAQPSRTAPAASPSPRRRHAVADRLPRPATPQRMLRRPCTGRAGRARRRGQAAALVHGTFDDSRPALGDVFRLSGEDVLPGPAAPSRLDAVADFRGQSTCAALTSGLAGLFPPHPGVRQHPTPECPRLPLSS